MKNSNFASPDDVENALYEALSNGNRALLAAVWSDEASATLIKASGEILTSGAKIVEDIASTFEGRGPLIYRLAPINKHQDQKTVVHCLEESVYIDGDRRRQSYVISTNMFAHTANGWKLASRQITTGGLTNGPRIERRELPNSLVRNLGVLDLLR